MIELAPAWFPTNFLDLAGLGVAVGVAIGFGFVIVITGFGGPIGMDLGVEGPVRKIDAANDVGHGGAFQTIGREPTVAIPLAQTVAHLRLGNCEWEQTFRADRRFDFFVRDDLCGAAEFAALSDARGIKDGDGLAALAFDGFLFGFPAALIGGKRSQSFGEVVFFDFAGRRNFHRRNRAAVGADERFFLWIPM